MQLKVYQKSSITTFSNSEKIKVDIDGMGNLMLHRVSTKEVRLIGLYKKEEWISVEEVE